MTDIEEIIPAFSMWKMFNDTVPVLIKGDCSESSVTKLASIIQSKEFLNIFIYTRHPALSFEQNQEVERKYKAFMTWLLGQFFYMLGYERFLKVHDTILETQLCVLEQLSKTQVHVYYELAQEYHKAFDMLINFHKKPSEKLVLQVFVPESFEDLNRGLDLTQIYIEISSVEKCGLLIGKLLKFVKYILQENFLFCSFDENTDRSLDAVLYLLSVGDMPMKLNVTDILVDIFSRSKHDLKAYSLNVVRKFRTFLSLFEQFTYYTYNMQAELKRLARDKFETLLISFLQINNDVNYSDRICNFIIAKQLDAMDNNLFTSPSVLLTVIKTVNNINVGSCENLVVSVNEKLNFSNCLSVYCFKQIIFKEVCELKDERLHVNVFQTDSCKIWNAIHKKIVKNFEEMECKNVCNMNAVLEFFETITNTLLQILIDYKKIKGNKVLYFFNEKVILLLFLKKYIVHCSACNTSSNERCLKFLVNLIPITNSKNIDIIFHFVAYPLLASTCYRSNNEFPSNFIGTDQLEVKMAIKEFYSLLSSVNTDKKTSLKHVNEIFGFISSGLLNLNISQVQQIEMLYKKLCTSLIGTSNNSELITLILEALPCILGMFDTKNVIVNIFKPIFLHQAIREKPLAAVPNVICCLSSDFLKILKWDDTDIKLRINVRCLKCHVKDDNAVVIEEFVKSRFGDYAIGFKFNKAQLDTSVLNFLLKSILPLLTNATANVKVAALDTLPYFSNHVLQFHFTSVVKIWIELAADPNMSVREKFADVIHAIVQYGQENTVLSQDTKTEILDLMLSKLLIFSKRSLQFSDYDLQDTLLNAIEEISMVKLASEHVSQLMVILIYFVMTPTSKYSLLAVNKCFKLARMNEMSTTSIYSQHKKELCKVIVHLSAVNQEVINYTLTNSLEKVSLMLGFYSPKDFLTQETNYVLPFLVFKTIKKPAVTKLIQEVATLTETDVGEMLACKYGYIFIHIFLEEMPMNEFKQCMLYLEKTTGMTGPTLRKRNFRIILNELLLNFHEKRDRVILALTLLADEDNENKSNSIPDYLQPHFLGILLYFDVKLISKNSKKDNYLLSLADLFKFMGSKHIMPLRFKIIAMLQTISYESFPHLICEVWKSFIHSCEIESLGPQLATIFVSMQPLLDHCPNDTNSIFRYLVLEKEFHTKNYIPDLFFVNNHKVDQEVLVAIKNSLRALEEYNLKQKIQWYLKYLEHEAVEVRVQASKQLKNCLMQSREELDKMILDYNGIDATIVELIDILTLGCREKDEALQLACGEVFGELGAIEPSHLPRRYTQEAEKSFSFFINEDSFIINALNELIRALQTEKNTQNMDRYALAIQEILKDYEISPDQSNSKHFLWEQFPESQKEVMIPLLNSRYMIAQPILLSNFPVPLYGSSVGASFESWLYNWTCSLMSSLPNERSKLLKVCLPSMRQNQRILMNFLPHILLHALLEGSGDIENKSFVELQTVTNSFTKKQELDEKVLNVRSIKIPGVAIEPQVVTPEEVKQMQCTKVVFILLDFLDRWLREWQWQNGVTGITNENFQKIKNFKHKLCKLQLAKCNYHCGEYPRALMYLEDYITENNTGIADHLSFLAEIYAQLDEADGVAGVSALQQNEPSIEQRILALEISGKLADATTCYEGILQPKIHHIQGLVQCYLDLDNVSTALNFVRGAQENYLDFGNMLLEMQAEPLWRLGQYEELESFLAMPKLRKNTSWGVQLGRALVLLKNGEQNEFKNTLDALLKQQVELFGAASLEVGAYQHGYNYISKLHALNELRQIEKTLSDLFLKPNDNIYTENLMKKLMDEWSLRIKVVQESVRVIEPILCMRRVSLNLAKKIAEQKAPQAVSFLNSLIGECWLLSAKTARSAGMHQQAYTYTVKAEDYAPPTLFLEKAKLHWLREEHEQAIMTLNRGLDVFMADGDRPSITYLNMNKKKICAEAKLLIATYNDTISNVDSEVNLQNYREAVDVYKEWEKSLVCLAQYYDKIFQSYSEEDRDAKGSECQLHMIHSFGKSLQYGSNYVYQSMPRMLSIWFDYGTRLLEVTSSSVREDRKSTLLKMTKLIDSFLERLPAFVFLTAFSQLVSRICHPQREVYVELKSIIIKLLQQYPQQSLWMIISVIKSGYAIRSKRCTDILCDPRLKTNAMTKLVKDFTSLAEKLIELCNKEIAADVSSTKVSILLRSLPRMLQKEDFSEIMMPTQKFRKLILPNPDFKSKHHNPFPNQYVHIVGIEDEVTILSSLQKPRKITLRGSDGKGYIYMLKPKDDLRKDFRLMEFNDIVNHLLSLEPEARQRRLNIRLYSVAPLNEECGLIEWVPNLVGLRPVLITIYKQKGLAMKGKELKEACCQIRDPLEKKREVFTKKLLPRHPPVLGDWFRKTFPDAQSWFTARTAYIRTTAVMSMVGYILGLGDRHGENISLDETCGDSVHVDFNCLFNKGETFDWPERVPFRLTHNMVSAMGPLGVEGVFRKSCACTLRVLRTNTNTLMSIVTPFVYDPLVSWPRNVPPLQGVHNAERTNEQAVDHIKNIQLRLEGKVKTRNRMVLSPLSVEGQTNYLINEAISVDNLCQMYIGWGPYL